jgi:hypothetical protein
MLVGNHSSDMAINLIKEWLTMSHFMKSVFPDLEEYPERWEVANAGVELAYLRARDALGDYVKERTKAFEDHDRILETIEETLQEKIKDIK